MCRLSKCPNIRGAQSASLPDLDFCIISILAAALIATELPPASHNIDINLGVLSVFILTKVFGIHGFQLRLAPICNRLLSELSKLCFRACSLHIHMRMEPLIFTICTSLGTSHSKCKFVQYFRSLFCTHTPRWSI